MSKSYDETLRENLRAACNREAETIEAIVEGRVYRDEEDSTDWTTYEDESDAPEDAEPVTVSDWLDDQLDASFTASLSDPKHPTSARVSLALGGPSIYLDTREGGIVGYWGTDQVFVGVSQDALDEVFFLISEYVEEAC